MSRADRKPKRKNRDRPDESFEPVMVDVSGVAAEKDPGETDASPEGEQSTSDTTAAETVAVETDTESVAPPETSEATIVTRDVSPVSESDETDWEFRPWPAGVGPRGAGYQVVVKRSVLNAINRHGKTTDSVEVCGVMVGDVYRDDVGLYLYVDACVVGEKAGHSAAQVTFTAETWAHIQGVMEIEHPDSRIVGWYHTHPGFGIFLSDMDLFIHGNFFNLPWQIAFVFDPVSGEEGLFVWRDGKTERVHFFIEEDVEKVGVITVPVSPEVAAAALADFSVRVQRIEKREKALWVMVALLVLIAVGWPFVLYTIMADKSRGTSSRTEQATRPEPPARVEPSEVTITPPTSEEKAPLAPKVESVQVEPPAPTTAPVAEAAPLVKPTETREKPIVIRPTQPTTTGARVLDAPAE